MAAIWVVVETKPHREFYAKRGLTEQGFEVFLPAYLKAIRHAGTVKRQERALLPKYLFVRLDLEHDRWRSINGTEGVKGVWCNLAGDRPRRVRDAEIDNLKEWVARFGITKDGGRRTPFTPGQVVRILEGLFVGRTFTVDEASPTKVKGDIYLFGRPTPFTFPAEALEPAA